MQRDFSQSTSRRGQQPWNRPDRWQQEGYDFDDRDRSFSSQYDNGGDTDWENPPPQRSFRGTSRDDDRCDWSPSQTGQRRRSEDRDYGRSGRQYDEYDSRYERSRYGQSESGGYGQGGWHTGGQSYGGQSGGGGPSGYGQYLQGGSQYGQGSYGQGSHGPGRSGGYGQYGSEFGGYGARSGRQSSSAYGHGSDSYGYGQGGYGPSNMYGRHHGDEYAFQYGRGGQGRSSYEMRGQYGYGSQGDFQGGFGQSALADSAGFTGQEQNEYGSWQQQRRSFAPRGYKRSDERVLEDVCERLMDAGIDASSADVSCTLGIVTLNGEVRSRADKHRMESVASGVSGVQDVENKLKVGKNSGSGPAQNDYGRGSSGSGPYKTNDSSSKGGEYSSSSSQNKK